MQVTLTKIVDRQKTSQKTGKPFTSRAILCNEYGGRWLSGFAGKENAGWREGDTVEINVEEKDDYLNFSVPRSDRAPAGGMTDNDRAAIRRAETTANAALAEARRLKSDVGDIMRGLALKGIPYQFTSDNMPIPTFDIPTETIEEPPLSAYED